MKTCLRADWIAAGFLVVLLVVAFPDHASARVEAATPEPGFYGLTGIGLAGLFAVVRKRRRRVK